MIRLRQGRAQDRAAVEEILAKCDMPVSIDPHECLLADAGERIVGFGRIEYAEGVAYLRPIVIVPEHRREGIGRQLLLALVDGLDELRVVARGEADDFYRSVGFSPMGWDSVYDPFRTECAECPDLAGCKPLPMRYRGRASARPDRIRSSCRGW